jgi:hypothetical protein
MLHPTPLDSRILFGILNLESYPLGFKKFFLAGRQAYTFAYQQPSYPPGSQGVELFHAGTLRYPGATRTYGIFFFARWKDMKGSKGILECRNNSVFYFCGRNSGYIYSYGHTHTHTYIYIYH